MHLTDSSGHSLVRRAADSVAGFIAEHLEELIAGTATVVVVLSVSWGVIARYVTAQPSTWTGELAVIAFAWAVFVGAAAGFKTGAHVCIDTLVTFLPENIRRRVAVAADVVTVTFLAYTTWLSIRFSILSWDHPTSVLHWPTSVIYIGLALGFALMTVRAYQLARKRRQQLAAE